MYVCMKCCSHPPTLLSILPYIQYQLPSTRANTPQPCCLRIIESLKECSSDLPTVNQYLFFFLKFIQSVVPTIEYDYTTGVQVRGR